MTDEKRLEGIRGEGIPRKGKSYYKDLGMKEVDCLMNRKKAYVPEYIRRSKRDRK